MVVTIAELAKALDARSWGDTSLAVTGVAEPADAEPAGPQGGLIAVATSLKYADALQPGSMAILAEGMDPEAYRLKAAIFASRPRFVMAGLTRTFDPGPGIGQGIHPTAVIDPSASIGLNATIGPFTVIGAGACIGVGARIASHVTIADGAVIGDDVLLHPGVRICHHVTIGNRFIAHPNAVVGGDGFSFVTPEKSGVEEVRESVGHRDGILAQKWVRIHSLGGVEIGDDVELGCNSAIDRGTIRATRIGSGTKIDNLVQIGHNVQIGQDCMICGQAGVAGSARIGSRVVLGGRVAVNDNIFVGDDVIAGGGAMIFTNAPAGRVLMGNPAVKMETQIEIQKAIRRLPRFAQQLAKLQETVTRLLEKG